MSDDVVKRCCDAFWSQTCEPGQEHDRARKALVSPMQAALAALKPGDKVGDGCVVVPVEPTGKMGLAFKERYEHEIAEGFRTAYLNMLAALDTGET